MWESANDYFDAGYHGNLPTNILTQAIMGVWARGSLWGFCLTREKSFPNAWKNSAQTMSREKEEEGQKERQKKKGKKESSILGQAADQIKLFNY